MACAPFVLFEISNRYIFEMLTEARVDSQSIRSVQPLPDLSNAMVKFSTADGNVETFMSTRAKSESAPGYGMPHSPVFLLTINVHLSLFGIVKSV
jgi:hypothetical protein